MSLLIITVLMTVAVALALCSWRRWSGALAVLALALFFAVGCGPVPRFLLHHLQSPYAFDHVSAGAPHTAIVLLGAGLSHVATRARTTAEVGPLGYGRLAKTLELYQACKRQGGSCLIVVSGGDPGRYGVSEAAVYARTLEQLGVEHADLLLEDRSLNTFQNAAYTSALLRVHPVERVLLVTSAFHLRRSVLYFARFGVRAEPVRADYLTAVMSGTPLTYNFLITDLALHEYIGVLRYFVYERMGWNVTADRPGAT